MLHKIVHVSTPKLKRMWDVSEKAETSEDNKDVCAYQMLNWD